MHITKLVYLVGLSVVVRGAEVESGCGHLSTIFVTAFPATQTVTVGYEVPSKAAKSHVTPAVQETDYVTMVRIISSVPAISTTALADEGPYYYTVNEGTRVWLDGKSPPAGKPLVTSTTVITYQPVPLSEYVANGRTHETASEFLSYVSTEEKPGPTGRSAEVLTDILTEVLTTVSTYASTGRNSEPSNAVLTIVNTKYETKVLTKIVPVSSVATASFIATNLLKGVTGAGLAGWNTTVKTVIEEKLARNGRQTAELSRQPTVAKVNPCTYAGTAFPLPTSSNSSGQTKNLDARGLGSVVSATIDGVVVSWANNYGGVPSIALAPATTSSIAVSQKLSVPTENEKVAYPIYPWDLQPIPVQVFSTRSSGSSQSLPLKAPLTQPGLPKIESSIQTKLQETIIPTTSSFKQSVPTTIVTSVVPVLPDNRASSTTASALKVTYTSASKSRIKQSVPTTMIKSTVPVLSAPPVASTTASTLRFTNTSATSRSALPATPSSCRGKAEFIIDFDDLPHFSTGSDDVDIPPIFNPYHKLFFEDHYGYVPPPYDPFPPVSPPQLAVYRANQGLNVDGSPDAGLESVGEFGAGPRASDSAYWIDAFSVWLGCENVGPSDCIVTINGYVNGSSTRVVSQTVIQPPCPGLVGCKLALVEFTDGFRNLSGVQFLATVDRKLTVYYIDDLSLRWSNNTCAAQKQRLSSR